MHPIYDTLTQLDDSHDELEAMSYLIGHAIHSGEDISPVECGVRLILDRNVDQLEKATDQLRAFLSEVAFKKDAGPQERAPRVGENVGGFMPSSESLHNRRLEAIGIILRELDADAIAQVAGTDRETVKHVLGACYEVSTAQRLRESDAYDSPDSSAPMNPVKPVDLEGALTDASAKELRDRFIAEKAREGVPPEEIAQAVNLKRATVERLIRKMNAEPDEADQPDSKSA